MARLLRLDRGSSMRRSARIPLNSLVIISSSSMFHYHDLLSITILFKYKLFDLYSDSVS